MTLSITSFWLALGAVFLLIEAFAAPGIGAFFAGMSALCVSVLLALGWVAEDTYFIQILWFLGLAAAWAVLLWKPMQHWRLGGKPKHSYSNMIGETAVVAEEIGKGREGKVTWSGTVMLAELAPTSQATSAARDVKVKIVAVKGAKLFVDLA